MAMTLLERVDGLADLVEAQVPQMEEGRRLTVQAERRIVFWCEVSRSCCAADSAA